MPTEKPGVMDQVETEDDFNLGAVLEIIQRRRKLLGIIWLTVLAVAVLLYVITPKKYRSTTTLQIERQDSASIAIEDLFRIEGANLEYYETQYGLLRSRGLAENAIRNLGLAQDPIFNPPRASWFGGESDSPQDGDDAAVLGGLANRLLGNLEVTPIRRTHLVEVSYVAFTPELAAKVANGVADAFIDWGIEKRYRRVGRASTFLSSQIEVLKQEIADKGAQFQAYGRSSDIVALDPQSNVIIQSLEALNRDYTAALSTRIEKESRYRELMSASEETIADTLASGLIAQLHADQAKLERDYANKLATYKPEWPMMQELKAQIDQSRDNLDAIIGETVDKAREKAGTEYQMALRREQSLAAELARKKGEAMELNSAAVEYNNLKVEVSTRRNLLDELLRRQSETMVASRLEGQGDSHVVVVDRALVPGGAYRPSLLLNLSMGLVLGLMLGCGGVYLVEYLDRTLKQPEEVERILGFPMLGIIPDLSAHSTYGYYAHKSRKEAKNGKDNPEVPIELLPQSHSRHAGSEAYRSLRTALLLSSAEGLKVVVTTSPGPNEGKSVTASNLAVVMAQLGRNVLLVDGDLRKPRLHEIFEVSNRVGLVSYLTGLAGSDDVILQTSIPKLQLMPSGPHSPNPAELLSSQRMQEFVTDVRTRDFDFVIFDAPPVLPVTDATLLGAMSDGVLLCLRAGKVLRADALNCKQRLQLAEVKILGTVLNAVQPQARYGGGYQLYEEYSSSTRDESGGTAA